MRFFILFLFCGLSFTSIAQFNLVNSNIPASNPSDSIWRFGSVAISHAYKSPFINKLLVTDKYNSSNNRTAYFGLNDPRFDLENPDSTTVGLATALDESHNVMVVNHYANFKSGTNFTDVHTSTAEFNFFRGLTDQLGYRDGGNLTKAAVLKVAANFSKNDRAYRTNEFDLINLRFFTGEDLNTLPVVSNFYALRMEDFRGINTTMLQNAWGIYIKPELLKNFFGGKVGIGTNSVTHKLTVSDTVDPLKIMGIQAQNTDLEVLTIDGAGVVHKQSKATLVNRFKTTICNETLNDDYDLYIHKGGTAIYTLPPANLRSGKIWKIVNVGSGEISLTEAFYEGNMLRNTILNVSGANSFEIFSDGVSYISL